MVPVEKWQKAHQQEFGYKVVDADIIHMIDEQWAALMIKGYGRWSVTFDAHWPRFREYTESGPIELKNPTNI